MNSLFLLLALSLDSLTPATTTPATTGKSVTFAPVGEWSILANATGTATATDKSVTVVLDRLILTVDPKYPTQRTAEFVACLAYYRSEGGWDTARCSKPIKHKMALQPGHSETIKDLTFVIPRENLPSIENFWLVLEVYKPPTRRKAYFVPSHSQKDIFQKHPSETTETGR